MSRSSSGFESSHLPSPENPALPLTLTSTSPCKTFLHSEPGCQPCIPPPSVRRPKNSFNILSSAKCRLRSGAIARSHSCTELRKNLGPRPLRRCLSLSGLHKGQKKKLINPKDWNLPLRAKTEESRQKTVTPKKQSKVTFPSCRSSTTANPAVCSTSNVATGRAFGPQTQSTDLRLPAVSSHHPIDTASHQEPSLTEAALIHNCTNHITSEEKRSYSVSATSEARRLKMKRHKKTTINPVNLGSVMEERLQSPGTDLKMEPLPEKVLASTVK